MRKSLWDVEREFEQTRKNHLRIPKDTGKGNALIVSSYTLNTFQEGDKYPRHTYRLRLRFNGQEAQFTYFQGVRNLTPPTAEGLIYCLIMDAEALDYPFGEWCDNFGYNSDSIKDRKTYDACQENGFKLRRVLGQDKIDKLRIVDDERDYKDILGPIPTVKPKPV